MKRVLIGSVAGLRAQYADDPVCHADEVGEDFARRRAARLRVIAARRIHGRRLWPKKGATP